MWLRAGLWLRQWVLSKWAAVRGSDVQLRLQELRADLPVYRAVWRVLPGMRQLL
jgi:hypothetical protein